jgi:predicted small metal-binding protein
MYRQVTGMETDRPHATLSDGSKSENLMAEKREDPSIPDPGDLVPATDHHEAEHMPAGNGSHCATLSCSAFRTVRQIGNPVHVKPEPSGNCVIDSPQRGSGIPEVSFGCRDLGFDCEFVVTETEAKIVLRKFIGHAALFHDLPVLPAEMLLRLQRVLKE